MEILIQIPQFTDKAAEVHNERLLPWSVVGLGLKPRFLGTMLWTWHHLAFHSIMCVDIHYSPLHFLFAYQSWDLWLWFSSSSYFLPELVRAWWHIGQRVREGYISLLWEHFSAIQEIHSLRNWGTVYSNIFKAYLSGIRTLYFHACILYKLLIYTLKLSAKRGRNYLYTYRWNTDKSSTASLPELLLLNPGVYLLQTFGKLLHKIFNIYKSKQNNIMNSQIPITQLQ